MLDIKYDIVGSFLRPQEVKEAAKRSKTVPSVAKN